MPGEPKRKTTLRKELRHLNHTRKVLQGMVKKETLVAITEGKIELMLDILSVFYSIRVLFKDEELVTCPPVYDILHRINQIDPPEDRGSPF